jgi:hypothetical protein
MPSNPLPATLVDPQLLDHAIGQVNEHLEAQLAWLATAYGKAERLTKQEERRTILYPGVYAESESGKEYINLFPDEHLGNFSFWFVADGWQISDYNPYREHEFDISASAVFWFDIRNVFPSDWKERTTQNVLRAVLRAFRTLSVSGLRLEIQQIWEETSNVYSGFSANEIPNQFRMRPYGCFRLGCRIKYTEPCQPMKLEGVNYWIVENTNIVQ